MKRRTFLATAAASSAIPAASRQTDSFKVGVIGHTGRGNYGHGLDVVWKNIPETRIVGVADGNPQGLTAAKEKLGAEVATTDYREMLMKVRPDIVAVCPRHPDQHHAMMTAALESGAKGIYVEKPFCRTPAGAASVVALAKKSQAKVAVAHRNRYHPTLQAIDTMIKRGDLGRVLEIRGRGKGDRRGGGEDLWVLGSHTVNLISYFAGRPLSCSAIMKVKGKPVTRADVYDGNEALGPLAGDEVHARYEMENGLIATFDSLANDQTGGHGFGLQIIGSRGIVSIKVDRHPLAHFVPGNPFEPTDKSRPWIPISTAGPGTAEPRTDLVEMISHHGRPARDLIECLGTDRQPLCSGEEGETTVQMICAVFDSHRQGGKAVSMPLQYSGNALELPAEQWMAPQPRRGDSA